MSMLTSDLCQMSSVQCQMLIAYIDPWDMLNNFCFHVYAQKLLFKGENGNAFFDLITTLSCDLRVHWAGSQLKNVWKSDKSWEPEKNLKFENLKI